MKTKKLTRYIAFLRGINVGGHRVKMERLRELFEAMNHANVSTFIASGNVIFDAAASDPRPIERQIEASLRDALGYAVDTFLRTPSELAGVVAHQAFSKEESMAEGHRVHVVFLREALSKEAGRRLPEFCTPVDDFRAHGRELYWLCRAGISESQVSWPKMAKALSISTTARNVSMLQKLIARHPPK